MNHKTRIELTDTMMDIIYKMSGGNPGAVNVLIRLIKEGAVIDPDSALGSLGAILGLDTLGIYEDRIWILYKDICDCSIVKFIAVGRANQLGMISDDAILEAIERCATGGHRIDLHVDDLFAAVKERLPDFGGPVPVAG